MGTNFYHKIGDGPERHIGKRSAGWRFIFRGYRPSGDDPMITTWGDWKRELAKHGKIFDEYGNECSLDDFIKMVEKTKRAKLSGEAYDHFMWPDPDGWEFTLTEFC